MRWCQVGFFVFDLHVWVIVWKEVLSMYPFKYFCFDLLPFDCLVKSYLKGVAEGTKSRQIQSVVLPEHIPLRRAVVWSEQINHFGVHTLHPNSVSGGVGGDVGWLGAALARRITRPPLRYRTGATFCRRTSGSTS